IEKRSSESSAGENALRPYAMPANALDQMTTAKVAAASVTASRRSMAESITTATSADLAGDETVRRDDPAGDAGRRESGRPRPCARGAFHWPAVAGGGLGLAVFSPVDRARQVALQEQHLTGDMVKFLQHGGVLLCLHRMSRSEKIRGVESLQ